MGLRDLPKTLEGIQPFFQRSETLGELDWATCDPVPGEHGEERGERFHVDILTFDRPADHKVWTCNQSSESVIGNDCSVHTNYTQQEHWVARFHQGFSLGIPA
jgi:hypothetical protein